MNHSKIEKVTLKNGLRVILLPDDNTRSAAFGIWLGCGSRFETNELSGISHFAEHMLFKGTERRTTRDIAESIDAIGGHLNAFTTKEYTCCYASALRSQLHLAIDIICDMVTSSRISPEDMELERGVILEEIGMYEDSPEDMLLDGIYTAMWEDSMLGANILGTRQTVSSITAEDIRRHTANQYTASRTVCAVSGSFCRDEVISQLNDALGDMPRGELPFAAQKAEYRSGIIPIKKDIEQLHICLGFPGVSLSDPRRHALGVLNLICGGASSSRLFQRMREELGLAYAVGSSVNSHMHEGIFEVDAAVSPDNGRDALSELCRLLCTLRRDGISEQELARAKDQLKASIIMGLEGNAAICAHMGYGELMRGGIPSEDEIIENIDGVSLSQVNAAAREFIDFEHMAMCVVGKVRDKKYYTGIVQSTIF